MKAALLTLLLLLALPLEARVHRSATARQHFKQMHPCPANGKTRGVCPGFRIDHRIGICVGGGDISQNMRWMTVAAAKAKDRWECKAGWQQKLVECDLQIQVCTGLVSER